MQDKISAAQAQKIAQAYNLDCLDDGLPVHPDMQMLAACGDHGAHPMNVSRDLARNVEMPSGFCLGDLVDSTDEEEPIHEETIYTPEWRLVEMLIEQFPDKVREHSVHEQIEFHEAAEESPGQLSLLSLIAFTGKSDIEPDAI